MTVTIIGVGVFRQLLQRSKMPLEIEPPVPGAPVTVDTVLNALYARYGDRFAQELYLQDGSPNLWIRIMLNGRDIRFLDEDKLIVHDGDSILLSSVMAGG